MFMPLQIIGLFYNQMGSGSGEMNRMRDSYRDRGRDLNSVKGENAVGCGDDRLILLGRLADSDLGGDGRACRGLSMG